MKKKIYCDLFFVLQMDFEGLTGRIHFGKYGERSDFMLDITKLDKPGLRKVQIHNDHVHLH